MFIPEKRLYLFVMNLNRNQHIKEITGLRVKEKITTLLDRQ